MRSEDRLFDVRDRVAIITGASGGLGERFARVLHGRGAHVVLAARRPERLDAIAASLPGSLGIVCDVGLEADRNRVVTSALDTFGKLDILVNNAGISGAPVPAERMPLDRWDRTLSVNLSGLFGMTQAAAQSMLAAGSGSIINIGSVFGLVANAPVTDVAYAATKGAVVNLTRELAAEWAARGVRINTVAPGWFPSEMTASMVADERSQSYVRRRAPMGRMGRVNELDGILVFLASDASSYCTGQTISIDGGWTIW